MTVAGSPSGEVQVGGHGTTLNKVVSVFAVIAAVIGALAATEDVVLGAVIGGAALVTLIVSAAVGLKRRSQRAFLSDSGAGFFYRDRAGATQIADDEVVGIHLLNKSNYKEGVLKSYTRKVNLKVSKRSDIDLVHTSKIDEFDPLAGFLDRTVTNYRERADEALDAGVRLKGKGWNLGRDDVELEGKNSQRIPINNLAAIDTIDEEYHVWDADNDEPVLRVPVKTENAFLLGLMLGPKIAEQNQDRKFNLSDTGLGRQIFRRTTGRFGRAFGWICIVFGIVILPVSIAFVAMGNAPDAAAFAIVGVFLAPFALLLGGALLRAEFRCHERGVFKKGLFSRKELRFENVDQFTYSATRQYYNGAYVGTAMSVKFTPVAGSGAKKFTYSRSVKNADDALDGLRDHISRVLMARMATELSETGQTQWMPNVRITNEGLYHRPKGFVKRKEEELLPYDQITGVDIQDGTFHVWKTGEKKSSIHESASEPNFFPGYYLLMALFAPDDEASQGEENQQT